jgi:hypothetical protein
MQSGTLIYKVKPSGKALKTLNKQTTDERIISLRKALGLNLRREAREYQFAIELRKLQLQQLQS